MAQSSGPIAQGTDAERQMSDVLWRDLFGDEPGVVGDTNGTAYNLLLASDSNNATIGSSSIASISKVSGFAHRIPVGQPEVVTVPPAVGSARTDIISVRYDPAYSGAPGPLRLYRIEGTSSALPSYDADYPGVEDLPLWSITRQPGQALSQATVVKMAPRITPRLLIEPSAPLPLSSPFGTIVRRGADEYVRILDGNGVPVWALDRPAVASYGTLPGNKFTVSGLTGTVEPSGLKHWSGWARNPASLAVTLGEVVFLATAEMTPSTRKIVHVPVGNGSLSMAIEFNPDGYVKILGGGITVPANTIWSFDAVSYR